MEIRNKGTVQNVTNIKSNVCFYYKCIINIYAQLQILINLYVSIINIVGGVGYNVQVGKIWSFIV